MIANRMFDRVDIDRAHCHRRLSAVLRASAHPDPHNPNEPGAQAAEEPCGPGQVFQVRLAAMATRPKADELSNRVATLEKRVSELANQLADHTASLPPFLLVGWV